MTSTTASVWAAVVYGSTLGDTRVTRDRPPTHHSQQACWAGGCEMPSHPTPTMGFSPHPLQSVCGNRIREASGTYQGMGIPARVPRTLILERIQHHRIPSTTWPLQAFSALARGTFGWGILYCGGCSVCRSVFSSIPGLHPLDARSTPQPPPQALHKSPEGQSHPGLRTTG